MKQIYDFAVSEQGSGHRRAGKPCEDASGRYSDETMAVIATADGHGSADYPRADRGARYAVEAALSSIREFALLISREKIDLSRESDALLSQLAKSILAKWHRSVEADLKAFPFREEELSQVSARKRNRYRAGIGREHAYGTTLIAACRLPGCWFALQVGDGRCVCFSEDGEVTEPIPWDEDCEGNITTSLCDEDALERFRFAFLSGEDCPAGTFLGCDGIENSYREKEDIYSLYRSVFLLFGEYGCLRAEEEVRDFLPGLSRRGSGDDVTIAGLLDSDPSPEYLHLLTAQNALSEAGRRLARVKEAEEEGEVLSYDPEELVSQAEEAAKECREAARALQAEKEAKAVRRQPDEKEAAAAGFTPVTCTGGRTLQFVEVKSRRRRRSQAAVGKRMRVGRWYET